ncbi:hypothetical protein [Streptomyces sp. NPDC006739]|uniref:hypothetical protein n=1 Tax=Streptomyces sp. NPDC006739 TaxID=3364763 RepID=UPI0036838F89
MTALDDKPVWRQRNTVAERDAKRDARRNALRDTARPALRDAARHALRDAMLRGPGGRRTGARSSGEHGNRPR